MAKDRDARFQVGGFQLGHETPFETGHQALLQSCDFTGRAVAGENDLFVRIEQGVEGVEEFFLHAFLAGQEVDVIDQQEIRMPIFLPELDKTAVLQCVDILVRESLGGHVTDIRS